MKILQQDGEKPLSGFWACVFEQVEHPDIDDWVEEIMEEQNSKKGVEK